MDPHDELNARPNRPAQPTRCHQVEQRNGEHRAFGYDPNEPILFHNEEALPLVTCAHHIDRLDETVYLIGDVHVRLGEMIRCLDRGCKQGGHGQGNCQYKGLTSGASSGKRLLPRSGGDTVAATPCSPHNATRHDMRRLPIVTTLAVANRAAVFDDAQGDVPIGTTSLPPFAG